MADAFRLVPVGLVTVIVFVAPAVLIRALPKVTLAGLAVHDLRQEPEAVYETMICLIKTHEDRAQLTREVSDRLLGKVA